MRITLQDAREEFATIPNLNLCVGDERLDQFVNRCQRRIIEKSRADLLHRRIRICVNNNCIVTPRGVAALTDAALCSTPIPVRNGWYEFLQNADNVDVGNPGYGPIGLHFRQECPHYRNITTTGSTVKIYTEVNEAAGAHVMLYGYDRYERKVRSDWDGDGEPNDGIMIPIVGPPNSFTDPTEWMGGGLLHVTKTATRGRVLMYEVNPITLAETLLAIYEDDETKPSYKQYLLRGTVPVGRDITLTAMAKVDFSPATKADDVLFIPSLEALRLMAEAIIKMDNNQFAEGVGISREAMSHFGSVRDHHTPIEQIAVTLRAQGSAKQSRSRIGGII